MISRIVLKVLDLGLCPKAPGFIALVPIPRLQRVTINREAKRSTVSDTPPRSWALDRRSGRFPALPYPPSRSDGMITNLRGFE